MSAVVIYQNEQSQTQVSVRLDGETVWLTQRQMAELFDTSADNISLHLKNVFSEGELGEPATTEDFSVVQTEGRRKVTRTVKHYNLDTIISVGYRVNSKRGVQFRQWATRVLREHLVQGYTFNQTRLAERGLLEARQTLDLLARTLQNQALVDSTGRAVLELIVGYADTWRLLLEYDENRLALPPGARPSSGVLDFARASAAIADFKRELIARDEANRCSVIRAARLWKVFSAVSNRPCSVRACTARAKRKPPTCFISSSRITRFPTATSASVLSFSCSTCNRKG